MCVELIFMLTLIVRVLTITILNWIRRIKYVKYVHSVLRMHDDISLGVYESR